MINLNSIAKSSCAAFLFLAALSAQGQFQDKIDVELLPKENVFMCPFLTPIFMRELTKSGAQEIRKDDQLVIHYTVDKSSSLDSATVYRIAEKVGFQAKYFTLRTTTHE